MNSDKWQLLAGVALALLGGPLTGAWIAFGDGPESSAVRGVPLVVSAILPFVPLVAWFRYRRSILIALSIFLSLSAGYYFAIGMWV